MISLANRHSCPLKASLAPKIRCNWNQNHLDNWPSVWMHLNKLILIDHAALWTKWECWSFIFSAGLLRLLSEVITYAIRGDYAFLQFNKAIRSSGGVQWQELRSDWKKKERYARVELSRNAFAAVISVGHARVTVFHSAIPFQIFSEQLPTFISFLEGFLDDFLHICCEQKKALSRSHHLFTRSPWRLTFV